MSEERMIRVTEREYHMYVDAMGYHFHMADLMESFEKLELAPSKNFKPKCYYDMINHGHRDDEGHIIYDGRVFKCVSCDIREQCIYKRE